MDGKRCAGESDLFSLTAAPKLDIKATYEDNCEDNEYQGYVVLTFEDATVDFTKVQSLLTMESLSTLLPRV